MNSRYPGDIELYTETVYVYLEQSPSALQIKLDERYVYFVHECVGMTYNALLKTAKRK